MAASQGSSLSGSELRREGRGPILNTWWRWVTSEGEDASLASWSGLGEAHSTGTLVSQLATCNLESFFSSVRI